VTEIQPDVSPVSTDYYAHIGTYREFSPPIKVRNIKQHISFLRNKDGLRGVPQHSIYEIDEDDFNTILEEANIKDVFSG
jgi:hypothetical protein